VSHLVHNQDDANTVSRNIYMNKVVDLEPNLIINQQPKTNNFIIETIKDTVKQCLMRNAGLFILADKLEIQPLQMRLAEVIFTIIFDMRACRTLLKKMRAKLVGVFPGLCRL